MPHPCSSYARFPIAMVSSRAINDPPHLLSDTLKLKKSTQNKNTFHHSRGRGVLCERLMNLTGSTIFLFTDYLRGCGPQILRRERQTSRHGDSAPSYNKKWLPATDAWRLDGQNTIAKGQSATQSTSLRTESGTCACQSAMIIPFSPYVGGQMHLRRI